MYKKNSAHRGNTRQKIGDDKASFTAAKEEKGVKKGKRRRAPRRIAN